METVSEQPLQLFGPIPLVRVVTGPRRPRSRSHTNAHCSRRATISHAGTGARPIRADARSACRLPAFSRLTIGSSAPASRRPGSSPRFRPSMIGRGGAGSEPAAARRGGPHPPARRRPAPMAETRVPAPDRGRIRGCRRGRATVAARGTGGTRSEHSASPARRPVAVRRLAKHRCVVIHHLCGPVIPRVAVNHTSVIHFSVIESLFLAVTDGR